MASIEQLERKVLELENQLREECLQTQTLLAKSNKALETALHAYKVDHFGFIWVYQYDTKEYARTDMRVMSPELVDEAVKTRHLADGAVTGEKIAADAIDSSKIKDKTIEGRSIKADAIGTEQIKDQSITGDQMESGALPNGKLANNAVSERTIQDRAVTADKIALGALGPQHFTPESFAQTIAPYFAELQHQIDAHSDHGGFVSDSFGSNPSIAVSQKTVTDAINMLWRKIEDMTGEVIQGFNMVVTPTFFVSDDGCDVHIAANTVETNGVFEWIEFWVDDVCEKRYENVRYIDPEECVIHLENKEGYDYLIECKAQIMGIEYPPHQHIITRYNEFYIGAGSTYDDVMKPAYARQLNGTMRHEYDVTFTDGQKLIIVMGASLYDGFIRADMNGVEIAFASEETVTIDGKDYVVLTSEAWSEGDYNIDING